eukprot:5970862-Prymnesium_polylepis.1
MHEAQQHCRHAAGREWHGRSQQVQGDTGGQGDIGGRGQGGTEGGGEGDTSGGGQCNTGGGVQGNTGGHGGTSGG